MAAGERLSNPLSPCISKRIFLFLGEADSDFGGECHALIKRIHRADARRGGSCRERSEVAWKKRSGGAVHSNPQQVEPGPLIHWSFQGFEPVNVAFGSPVVSGI
jgi:hypothetical protein